MSRRLRAAVGWVVVVGCAAVLGFFAGRTVLTPPDTTAAQQPAQEYTVADGTVGRSSTFRVDVAWPRQTVGRATGAGTVTSVDFTSGEVASAGTTLFHVDLVPVVLAQGEVPAFRDLCEGTRGTDVTQLRQFLRDSGYLNRQASDVFDAATTTAVKAWQKNQGTDQTGCVGGGAIVFAPQLPARVVLGEDVTVGGRLEDGTSSVEVVSDAPRLTIAVEGNAAVPSSGTAATLRFADRSWEVFVGSVAVSDAEDSVTALMIDGVDGAPACGTSCAEIPLEPDPGTLTASVEVVPYASGPVVPVAALSQQADGGYVIVRASGDIVPVTIVVTDGSRAVVDGDVAEGDRITLFPGDETSAAPSPTGSETS